MTSNCLFFVQMLLCTTVTKGFGTILAHFWNTDYAKNLHGDYYEFVTIHVASLEVLIQ